MFFFFVVEYFVAEFSSIFREGEISAGRGADKDIDSCSCTVQPREIRIVVTEIRRAKIFLIGLQQLFWELSGGASSDEIFDCALSSRSDMCVWASYQLSNSRIE